MGPEAQLVERLHSVLVEEIRTRRPKYLQEAFTVAEIYQDLVPYRSHRDRIGATMNGDYEHALLKLLAGEGGFLVLESEAARRRLAEELGSPDPNTGIFREYAALDVRLNPSRIPEGGAAGGAGARAAPAPPIPPTQPEKSSKPPAPTSSFRAERTVATPAEPRVRPKPVESSVVEALASCRWCSQELPRRETLRFCPHCGVDVNLLPCPSCGEQLESGWRYCIACGTSVQAEG